MSSAKTKARKAKSTDKPKQDLNAINQLGLKAHGLATQHQAAIGARLSPGFLTALADDLAALVAAGPQVITTRHGSVQLTAAQNQALLAGYKLVKALRTTVKGHEPEKDVRLAYGIGTKVNTGIVKDVTAALQTILDRVTAYPEEALSFGIVNEDISALNAAIAAIAQADQEQEQARAQAPQTTAQRNVTARRILAGIKKVAGAGMRAFADDPTLYGSFEALAGKSRGRGKKANTTSASVNDITQAP